MHVRSRPEITMVLAVSADGRLVSGDSDSLDPNHSWKKTNFVKSIIYQFFDFSSDQKIFNLAAAETLIRLGLSSPNFKPKKSSLRLVVLDQDNDLNSRAIINLAGSVQQLIVIRKKVQTNRQIFSDNCSILEFVDKLDLKHTAKELKSEFGVTQLTVQSAGEMNSAWIKSGIVDHLTVIIYPLLVGDNGTPPIVSSEYFPVQGVNLIGSAIFDHNYISLQYDLRKTRAKRIRI